MMYVCVYNVCVCDSTQWYNYFSFFLSDSIDGSKLVIRQRLDD